MRKNIITLFVFLGGVTLLYWSAMPVLPLSGASAPTVDSVTAAATSGGSESTLTLTENTTTTLYAHGAITDVDGCEDVATNGTVTGKFYRSNHASGASCSADNNDCYSIINADCTKTACNGPGDNTFTYQCTAAIYYYADSTANGPQSSTDWTAKIIATDASTATGNASDTIEMGTTIALDITPSINYGLITLGDTSAEQTLITTNTGNSGVDVNVSTNGTMTCSIGYLAPTAVRYSLTQGFSYADGTELTAMPAEIELNLANRTDDASPSTKNTYLKLKLPLDTVGGDCSNTLTVTAVADTEGGW